MMQELKSKVSDVLKKEEAIENELVNVMAQIKDLRKELSESNIPAFTIAVIRLGSLVEDLSRVLKELRDAYARNVSNV